MEKAREEMGAKTYSKTRLLKNNFTFFAPFSPRLASKFAKSAYMTQEIFFSQKNQYGYQKTQNFMLSSNL
jgi:hypothetical protein